MEPNTERPTRIPSVEGRCGLTPREYEILVLTSQGCSKFQVAIALGVGIETIRSHSIRLRRKLEATNMAHAVAIAYKIGILTMVVMETF